MSTSLVTGGAGFIGAHVTKMTNWVKKHGAKETQKFKKIEILENLPIWSED